jgi:hypothetical protein
MLLCRIYVAGKKNTLKPSRTDSDIFVPFSTNLQFRDRFSIEVPLISSLKEIRPTTKLISDFRDNVKAPKDDWLIGRKDRDNGGQ